MDAWFVGDVALGSALIDETYEVLDVVQLCGVVGKTDAEKLVFAVDVSYFAEKLIHWQQRLEVLEMNKIEMNCLQYLVHFLKLVEFVH